MMAMFQLNVIVSVDDPDIKMKLFFLISFGFFLITGYMIFGYGYLVWSTPLKNKLVKLTEDNHNVLIYKFDRYFVDEAVLHKMNINPKPYVRLSQKDYRDIICIVENEE
ncbi:hypothetical protein ABER99_21870 [Paenibacillus glucanolyticus]|nr:hypothetical protein [Paenibacillus glucanolyticus]